MGYMRHHAVLVTGFDTATVAAAREMAIELAPAKDAAFTGDYKGLVSPLIPSPVNGYNSFVIGPDGSKEGWPDSDKGDEWRASFIGYLETQRYGDNSSPLQWALVQYGDEDGDDRLLDSDHLALEKSGRSIR